MESIYRACADVVIVRAMEDIMFGCFLGNNRIDIEGQYVSDG